MRFGKKILSLYLVFLSIAVAGIANNLLSANLQIIDSNQEIKAGSPIVLEITPPQSEHPWTIDTKNSGKWIEHGPLLIDFFSLATPEERKTKLILRGIVIKSGSETIPPIIIRQENSDLRAQTNSSSINSKTILQKEDEKIPWTLPPLVQRTFAIEKAIAIALLLLVFFIFFIFWVRKKYFMRKLPKASPLQEYEAKIDSIEREVSTKSELDQAAGKKFSFAISSAVRQYLSQESKESLLDLTDEELLQSIRSHPRLSTQEHLVKEILQKTMEARYNSIVLQKSVAVELLRVARKILIPKLIEEGKKA